eukprot:3408811-Alexandrium_andersonii.AAC.1
MPGQASDPLPDAWVAWNRGSWAEPSPGPAKVAEYSVDLCTWADAYVPGPGLRGSAPGLPALEEESAGLPAGQIPA